GGNTATFHQLFDAAMHQQDAGLRTEALRASLNAFEAEPDLRSRVLTVVAGVDDVALGQALRGIAGARAEEIANQAATQAQTAELRSKALSVLQRLRTIGSPGGRPTPPRPVAVSILRPPWPRGEQPRSPRATT